MAHTQHEAWTLLAEFEAAAKDIAAHPEAYTPAKGIKVAALEQQVYAAAPSAPGKEGGEILMAVADISKQTGIHNRKGKHRREDLSK